LPAKDLLQAKTEDNRKARLRNNPMSELVVRDLDPVLIQKLRLRSQKHGRSLEEEVKTILEQTMKAEAAVGESLNLSPAVKLEQARASYSGLIFSDSTALIREDRDR